VAAYAFTLTVDQDKGVFVLAKAYYQAFENLLMGGWDGGFGEAAIDQLFRRPQFVMADVGAD
jgi:hypothetical protein